MTDSWQKLKLKEAARKQAQHNVLMEESSQFLEPRMRVPRKMSKQAEELKQLLAVLVQEIKELKELEQLHAPKNKASAAEA